MEHPIAAIKRRIRPYYDASIHILLLLSLLKQIILLLHAVYRGSLTLEDLQDRLQSQAHDDSATFASCDDKEDSSMDFNDMYTNFDQSRGPLANAAHTLCKAIVRRDLKLTTRVLEILPSLASKRHDGGWTPLHAAVLTGEVDIIRQLLYQPSVDVNADYDSHHNPKISAREAELGANVTNTQGATPLHFACMVGNLEIIKILVENGASFDKLDDQGRAPIEYFDLERDAETISEFHDLLLEWRRRDEFYRGCLDIDDLATLVRNNEFNIFEHHIRQNPYLASKLTHYDFSLLHLAVIRQLRPFVELLLSIYPSGVNMVDERSLWDHNNALASFAPPIFPHKHVKNATPLHYACLTHNMEIIELLLKAGADWTIEDSRGRKPEDLLYDREGCERAKWHFAHLRDSEIDRRKNQGIFPHDMKTGGEDECGDMNSSNSESPDRHGVDDINEHSDGDMEFSDKCKKESAKLDTQSLFALEKSLGDKLIGQAGPIRTVANAIRHRECGWVDPDRPLVMLFLGSSGVGKTELAKQLALYIHGKDGLSMDKGDNIHLLEKECGFIRVDMSEFQESHTVLNLIGAPKSYVGYGDGGSLTQSLKKNPRAIVLLDEIEKAHPDVITLFLQVFDDGRLTDSKDGVIYCQEAVFIMTSNLASDEIKIEAPQLRHIVARAEVQGRPEEYLRVVQEFTRSIHPELKRAFRRDEFLGRINEIAVFLPLSDEEIHAVIERELALWRMRAEKKHGIKLSWTGEVVAKLATAYDVNYGVRSVANQVQRIAIQLVADAHMRGLVSQNGHAHLETNLVGDIILGTNES